MNPHFRIVENQFQDFDQFRDSLVGWDTDLTQVSSGPFSLEWTEIAFDDGCSLSSTRENSRLVDRMTVQDNSMMLVVCFTPSIFSGIELSEGTLLIFGPGREYLNILPQGYHDFTLFASTDYLRNHGLTIGDESFDDLTPEQSVFSLTAWQLDGFRQLSRTLNMLARQQPAPNDQDIWALAARERAIGLFKRAIQQSNRQRALTLVSKLPQRLLTARALSHIDEAGLRNESVASICNSLGCSTRTLQIAFEKTLGLTPLQYLLARRLQSARHNLLTPLQRKTTVTEIAAENEFFHFGRFAEYYGKMYGELPSETIGRAHRLSIHEP